MVWSCGLDIVHLAVYLIGYDVTSSFGWLVGWLVGWFYGISNLVSSAQSPGAVEYTDCISAEG